MPTVCEESGASSSRIDLGNRLLSSGNTHDRCTCHGLTPSGRLFGRTFSLDPEIFNRCNECHKEKTRVKSIRYEKIAEDEETARVHIKEGGTKVFEDRVGGTQLVHDPDNDLSAKLLNTEDEQSENDSNKKLESCDNSDPERQSPSPRVRKPWTRRKRTLKVILTLTVIALSVAGVVLGVLNGKSKDSPVNQELTQQSTPSPVTDRHIHFPMRNCTLAMELDKNSIAEEPSDIQTFKTYTLPWRPLSSSDTIFYSPDTMTFNVTRSGQFTLHIDVHIDTNFWIDETDLEKTFSSVLCIQFSSGTLPKKCITNKYNSRTVNTQQVHAEVYLAKGDNFYVTIGVNTLHMIYHLPTEKNNLIEITSKKC